MSERELLDKHFDAVLSVIKETNNIDAKILAEAMFYLLTIERDSRDD